MRFAGRLVTAQVAASLIEVTSHVKPTSCIHYGG
jgi:hypothetical protein